MQILCDMTPFSHADVYQYRQENELRILEGFSKYNHQSSPCIPFMLKILIPAAEHMQLTTTEHVEHFYPCHVTFQLVPLPQLDNILPVVLQLNVRCRSNSSSLLVSFWFM